MDGGGAKKIGPPAGGNRTGREGGLINSSNTTPPPTESWPMERKFLKIFSHRGFSLLERGRPLADVG